MLFTERSIWTMIHGIGLGGGFLIIFSAVFHCLWSMHTATAGGLSLDMVRRQCRFLAGASVLLAIILWLTVLVGTFISFPAYRANPPADAPDLAAYPKALLMSDHDTAWLHETSMEMKEHMPWTSAILITAVAFVAIRYREKLANAAQIRATMIAFLSVTFGIVGFIALMGVFINKVAPLF